MTTEDEIITRYFKALSHGAYNHPADLAIGDDAALLNIPNDKQLVISTDNLISGVHFPDTMQPVHIGWRALAINLSDLAAMGAQAAWFTLNLCMPSIDEKWLAQFSCGLANIASNYSCQLIGGNTSFGALNIGITVYGLIDKGKAVLRNGAQPGDAIYVTGCLGDAAAGLACIQQNITNFSSLVRAFEKPTPRIEIGAAITTIASSMLDLSDGLHTDLNRILTASGVGAKIQLEELPISADLSAYYSKRDAREIAICGGDDYELCFTIPQHLTSTLNDIAQDTGVPCTKIGQVISEKTVSYLLNNLEYKPRLHNIYQHFSHDKT